MTDLERIRLVGSLLFAGYLAASFLVWMALDQLHRHQVERKARRQQ